MSASILIALAARPVAAAPGAPPSGNASNIVRVPPDALSLTLSQIVGSGLAVTLDSGASEEHDLVLSNHTSDLRLTVKLTATDATGNLGTDAASWLAFGDDEIQLDPHAATIVPMTIAVPHDTQPGSALAHVSASVENAVAAADGSTVTGTASRSMPVSIVVRGTPTAQIAIADVHRVDQGSQHQLALVIRNFGDQGARVTGHVTVAGDRPQTLPFHADLAGSRDTTVDLDWKAPPQGTPSDIAVELDYGGGKTAMWSSRLGGAPTKISTGPTDTDPTPTTIAPATMDNASSTSGPATPWWKQPIVTVLAILALLGAALWFGLEMRSSSRRRRTWAAGPPMPYAYGPGWTGPASEESVDLAKQLVRLTEVVVELVAVHRDEQLVGGDGIRARSPDVAVPPVPVPAPATSVHPPVAADPLGARAGPEPPPPQPDRPEVVDGDNPDEHAISEPVSSAPPAPGLVALAEPVDENDDDAPPVAAEAEDPLLAAVRAELARNPEVDALVGTDEEDPPAAEEDEPPVAAAEAVDALVVTDEEDPPAQEADEPPVAAQETDEPPVAAQETDEPLVAADAVDALVVSEDDDSPEAEVAAAEPLIRSDGPEDPLVAVARDELAQEDEEKALVAAALDELAETVTADPFAEAMRRLTVLDRERRQLHEWMDEEDATGELLDPPPHPIEA